MFKFDINRSKSKVCRFKMPVNSDPDRDSDRLKYVLLSLPLHQEKLVPKIAATNLYTVPLLCNKKCRIMCKTPLKLN